MSKKGFAEAVGVTSNTVLRYEAGDITPPGDMIDRIAHVLGFPSLFFFGADVDRPRMENASFRGLSSKSARVMRAALASGTMAYVFDDWVGRRFDRQDPDLPDLDGGIRPDVAAKLLRQHWRLGDKPIENMVHLLEAKGIRVFSLAENTAEVDAFSVWREDCPYIFLNRFKSAERSRFDAAHELAHLCMHKHGGSFAVARNNLLEREANAFAGAFLMPEADLRSVIKGSIYSVDDLIRCKKRWRVAAAALAYRLKELGLISDSRGASFYVEMSRRGWLKQEPDGIPREQSYIWQQVMDGLRADGVSKTDISLDTGIPPQEIEALLFGLANMLTIEGDGATTPQRNVGLRLVR